MLQSVVVAVASSVTGFQSVVGVMSTLRYRADPVPFGRSWTVSPMSKRPELSSGPRIGDPSAVPS